MNLSFKHKKLPLAVMLATGLTAPLALVAAEADGPAVLEEVMVTAQKRSESLQDTPVAVTAYNEQSLETLGVSNLADLSIAAPSLQSYDIPTSANNLSLLIRVQGNLDSQTLTTDNPVGIYVDDVYIARSTGALVDLLDLERIEILRGPQGTLYGRNSSAGAIKFITKKPAAEQGFQVKSTLGNNGLASLAVSADIPVSDTFRTKVSVMSSTVDGWVENKGSNSTGGQAAEDFNAKDQSAARVALSWDASDTITVDYSFDYADVDSMPPYFQSASNSRDRLEETESILVGGSFKYVLPESDMEQQGHNLTITAQLNDATTFKSISSYREMDDHVYQNWSGSLFFATDLAYSTEAFSQEFQLLGSVDKFSYVAGLYYFSEDGEKFETQYLNYDSGADFTPGTLDDVGPIALDAMLNPLAGLPFVPASFGGPIGTNLGFTSFDTTLTSTAVFGQGTYEFTDQLSVTLGVRYTEDDREATREGTNAAFTAGNNDESFDNTDWTLIADYIVNENINTYAKVATGYRSGGSSERAPNFTLTFEPEQVTSYELGVKSELMDRRLRVNAALFRTETDDAINTVGGTGPQGALQETLNFGEVEIDGVELDILALVGETTTIGFNYVYLDGELSDVVVPAESILNVPGADITDVTYLAQIPENAYSITLDHGLTVADMSLNAHLDYSYRDDVNSSAVLTPVGDLGLWNARLTWSDIAVSDATASVSLWVKNLTDEEEIVYDLSQAGNQFNAPRTYGVDFKMNF
jgi:iron complex outermembrane receptor protein